LLITIVAAVVVSSLSIALIGLGRGVVPARFRGLHTAASSVLAIEILRSVVSEARKLLHSQVAHGLATELVERSRIVNSSLVLINGAAYRYIVVQAIDAEHRVSIAPQRISIDGVSIELLPRSTSTTFTGGTQYTYLVKLGNRVCRVSFYLIGFQIAYASVVTDSESVCNGIYGVSIFVNPHPGSLESYKGVFLVLIPVNGSQ